MKLFKLMMGTLALCLSVGAQANAQAIEKPNLTLGVGGKTALYYLPLTICERLGYQRLPRRRAVAAGAGRRLR